jgi:IclR family KDG regulon transcriptional repressor
MRERNLLRGIDIISSFDFQNQSLSAKSISGSVGLPLSTTYRYLKILTDRGFLMKEAGDRMYRLGYRFLKLGNLVFSSLKFVDFIRPHMERLSSQSGETVLLTVISGWESVCVERIEADKRIKMTLDRGASLPLHAGASSKILLAYQENKFIQKLTKEIGLPRLTSNTITETHLLENELKTIRERGFAISDQEADPGVAAIAAPVFDERLKLLAGMSVVGTSNTILTANKDNFIKLTLEAACNATISLGGRR